MVMCSGRAGASTTVVPRSRPPQVAPIRAPSTPVRRQEWGHMYRGLHPTPSTRGPAHCPHPSGYRHYHGTVAMKAPKRHVKSMGLDKAPDKVCLYSLHSHERHEKPSSKQTPRSSDCNRTPAFIWPVEAYKLLEMARALTQFPS